MSEREPLKAPVVPVDIRDILHDLAASISAVGELDLGVLSVGDEDFELVEPATYDVLLTNAGTGVVASGTVTARVNMQCSRCLVDFESTLVGEVEGFYASSHTDELPDDQEVYPIKGEGHIDIGEPLLAALTIEAPFAPLHDPDCKGICPQCGTDLNITTCACVPVPAEKPGPFDKLKELLPDLETDIDEP